jgi:hypothetical protein
MTTSTIVSENNFRRPLKRRPLKPSNHVCDASLNEIWDGNETWDGVQSSYFMHTDHVLFSVADVIESFATNLALVRFFTSVYANVATQVSRCGEGFPAHVTAIRTLARVGAQVDLQTVGHGELLATVPTRVVSPLATTGVTMAILGQAVFLYLSHSPTLRFTGFSILERFLLYRNWWKMKFRSSCILGYKMAA